MKITCGDTGTATGKPCGSQVAKEGYKCYRHRIEKQVKIPKDISQVVGKKPVINPPRKKPKLVVIDDIFEGGEIPKEIFEPIMSTSANTEHYSSSIVYGSGTPIIVMSVWGKIKNFFKREKK